ncbi:hypothetical protein LCGC14_1089880 [marine sediment metagenome]|uniref:Uncharacterized protein n=1 Tax=marine sediment metagenome TaxID=412755 RepID=A0A0F9MH60_9ZZZZ
MAIKRKTTGTEIPPDLAGRWELIVDEVKKIIREKRKRIKAAIGERPYRGLPVEKAELTARWAQIRHDVEGLTEVLQTNTKFKPDGRVLAPKALIRSMIEQERGFREGGL